MTPTNTSAPHSATPEDQPPAVLVIDDSPDVHRLLRAKLKNEELTLHSAMNGEEGIARAAALQPAAIILDLDMQGLDGLAVIRLLKGEEGTQDIPIVVLSGHRRPEDKVAAFELGAVDYITKPFEFTELRVRLRSVLRMRQLLQLLEQRARVDGLTGLWNRAFFNERWHQEHARCHRHGHALSMAILDMDHFKQINDTYGHPAGDTVLMGLGRILQRECRLSDFVCRYGGEEFVIVMPDTSAADATILCERVRESIQLASWTPAAQLRVTVSIGIAGASTSTPLTPQQWVEAADRSLYGAKKNGRNRVCAVDLSVTVPARLAG